MGEAEGEGKVVGTREVEVLVIAQPLLSIFAQPLHPTSLEGSGSLKVMFELAHSTQVDKHRDFSTLESPYIAPVPYCGTLRYGGSL